MEARPTLEIKIPKKITFIQVGGKCISLKGWSEVRVESESMLSRVLSVGALFIASGRYRTSAYGTV